ncbi:DMT family transporter [Rhizobium sp. L1K21]|uniref:DMT family transporter n=1 Tax=Rhizobium sp. L1K21 TaxID=2954933 RepID=UPI002092A279|nr:DMT family transporter [Rhizobium sp. L1K21]MCO6185572.1 DMT family transporter [Rhizobium sp. L1K21]
MPVWVAITISAAFLQNIRSVLQKHLKGAMGTTGATFVRFAFGVPFAVFYLFVYLWLAGKSLPSLSLAFGVWVVVAALSQIFAQALLVHMFSFRNFAVGTAYSRTEPAQAAIFAFIVLGETISAAAVAAIVISVIGVMLISVARTAFSLRTLITSTFSRTALLGLASGALFGVSANGYRSASLALAPGLAEPDFILQASFTLVVAIAFQTVIMAIWIALREPQEFGNIARAWKPSLATGFVGATASFGWFMAMTLQKAAIVKALAQIEMLFTFASSVFIFKEKINRLEIAGCGLIVAGILVLLLG